MKKLFAACVLVSLAFACKSSTPAGTTTPEGEGGGGADPKGAMMGGQGYGGSTYGGAGYGGTGYGGSTYGMPR